MNALVEMIVGINPVLLALFAGIFTWSMTILGSSVVFLLNEIKQNTLKIMLAFAAGVMIAASFWSLLLPAVEISADYTIPWLPVVVGFSFGGLFLLGVDRLLPHMHSNFETEGINTTWKKSTLLMLAITLHNIPEGLAFGVAFAAAAGASDPVLFAGAISLAIGIGIQNIPEGAAVSLPFRKAGLSKSKSFFYGQLSGLVEPIAAVCGAILALSIDSFLPYMLSFAAGAMIYVSVEDLIPEAQCSREEHSHGATYGIMIGFLLMTFVDMIL